MPERVAAIIATTRVKHQNVPTGKQLSLGSETITNQEPRRCLKLELKIQIRIKIKVKIKIKTRPIQNICLSPSAFSPPVRKTVP